MTLKSVGWLIKSHRVCNYVYYSRWGSLSYIQPLLQQQSLTTTSQH